MFLHNTVPGDLDLDTPETSITATSITVTGSVSDGSVVTRFVVQWQRNTSVGCSNMDGGSKFRTGNFNSYEITGLQPDSRYIITIIVFNTAGSVNHQVTAMTLEAGRREINLNLSLPLFSIVPSSSPSFISSNTRVTASSITVQWREIPCTDRNGEITDYRVQVVRGEMVEKTTNVPGGTREATISGLSPSTQYTVQVAAVNGAGTASFRGISIMTSGE